MNTFQKSISFEIVLISHFWGDLCCSKQDRHRGLNAHSDWYSELYLVRQEHGWETVKITWRGLRNEHIHHCSKKSAILSIELWHYFLKIEWMDMEDHPIKGQRWQTRTKDMWFIFKHSALGLFFFFSFLSMFEQKLNYIDLVLND